MTNPDSILDIQQIKTRSISGVIVFTLRTLLISVFNFFAIFILTIILKETEYGIYILVSAILNLFVYFSDIGLAAALIQTKEEPQEKDLASAFTIQQLIVITLVVIGLLLSSKLASFYNLDNQGLLLLRVLIFSLLLSSLKTIPSIILERKLKFTRLVIPQIVENIIFYGIAIVLAARGLGIASFTWAVLARSVIGLILIYSLSPWKPAIGFAVVTIKKLTSFGFPFQLNSVLALLKDDLLIVFLGKILSFANLGYIGWSQKWAFAPMRFFMDSINRVTFPAYSRLQEHKENLGKAIEKSLFFVTYFVYPSIFGMMAIAPSVIALVPKYQKWEPALLLLYLFAINAIFSSISTTFTNALFAMGKSKIVLNLMIFWTAVTWILTYPLVLKFGYIGVGLASAIVAVTSLSTIYFVKKEISINIGKSIFGPLSVSIIMFVLVRGFLDIYQESFFGLILAVFFGAIIYFIISWAIFKRRLIEDGKIIINSLIGKR